jgi:hypothetical protein
MLTHAGFSDESMVTIAQDVSVDQQTIRTSRLREFQHIAETGERYFSIMVVKKK